MVTTAQMETLEGKVLSSGLPIEALMEKVGQAMASWFINQQTLIDNGVIVLIGPGHNGGDGLVVARELFLKGVDVKIWCPLKVKAGLTANLLSHSKWLGIKELHNPPNVESKALWIEALFGLGQCRPLPNSIADLLEARREKAPGKLVSLDIPAGLCSDSGRSFQKGSASALFTLTVGLIKQGLVQDLALPHVGKVVRIDVGIPNKVFLEQLPKSQPLRLCSTDIETLPFPKIEAQKTKYQRGRLLVVAGSKRYRGAALLALQGALASGAGSIQAGLPSCIGKKLWQVAPEIVLSELLNSLPDINKGVALSNFFEKVELSRVDALLIGPGIGQGLEAWSDFSKPLEAFSGLLVLDADGINRLAQSSEGWKWLKKRNGPTWLTPHQKEFHRLFPELKGLSPVNAAVQASLQSGAGVLLKGAHSVVADDHGCSSWQLGETAPWAARTGLGDVLAGYTAGLGAIAIASEADIQSDLLAAAALLHAESARNSAKSSSASDIASSLAELTTSIQSRGDKKGSL